MVTQMMLGYRNFQMMPSGNFRACDSNPMRCMMLRLYTLRATCSPLPANPIVSWARSTVLGSLVVFVCGFAAPASAIYMGTDDLSGQYGGVGMILPIAGHSLCTGTMLSETVFLTAAQCVLGLAPAPDVQFSLGAGMTARMTEIRMHPGFDTPDGFNLPYDIALVALDKTEVAFWTGITHWAIGVGLPPTSAAVTAVGFGENQTGVGSGQRRSGNLAVTQYIGGEAPVGVFIPDAFLETQPADVLGQIICPGDNGGPLLYNNAIVGVASFRTVATCNEAGPGYYVNIPGNSEWIGENLNQMDPPKAIPEPPALALFAIGFAALGLKRRKKP